MYTPSGTQMHKTCVARPWTPKHSPVASFRRSFFNAPQVCKYETGGPLLAEHCVLPPDEAGIWDRNFNWLHVSLRTLDRGPSLVLKELTGHWLTGVEVRIVFFSVELHSAKPYKSFTADWKKMVKKKRAPTKATGLVWVSWNCCIKSIISLGCDWSGIQVLCLKVPWRNICLNTAMFTSLSHRKQILWKRSERGHVWQTGRSWAKTPKTSWVLSLENCGPAVDTNLQVDCQTTVAFWDSETHDSLKPYQLLIGLYLHGLETWTHETSVPTNEGDTSSRNTSGSSCLDLTSWISSGKATENLPQWVGQRSSLDPEEYCGYRNFKLWLLMLTF